MKLPTHIRTRPTPVQIRLAGAALLVLDLFGPWQQVSASGPLGAITASRSGWHGIGVVVGISALALIAWELARLLDRAPALPIAPEITSRLLAALAAGLCVLEFLSHSEARHWPAWLGLLLGITIAASAAADGVAPSGSRPERA